MFHGAASLVPLIDRLTEHLVTIDIAGKSYRQKDNDKPPTTPRPPSPPRLGGGRRSAEPEEGKGSMIPEHRFDLLAPSEWDVVLSPELAPLFVLDAAIVAAHRVLCIGLDPSSFSPGGAGPPPCGRCLRPCAACAAVSATTAWLSRRSPTAAVHSPAAPTISCSTRRRT